MYSKIKEKTTNYGRIQLEEVSTSFNDTKILDEFSLIVDPSQFVSILGTSGIGKTTLLRVISGFKRISGGYLRINGQLASSNFLHVTPERRNLGFVLQDYALFPHLNVFENIGYGISKKDPNRQIKIKEMLNILDLSNHQKKIPSQLSGGQQQRVAIGRAMAINPSAILMDEPFSNLDFSLKKTLSSEIKKIINRSGTSTIMVTHDESEAERLSDKCYLMENGKLRDI
ncbi:MAG: ABC transporter ATP-binding protein [Chloroflexota bacterium]|nr:ABC transporter ATP-binding protein [Chloroflexota bacterium]